MRRLWIIVWGIAVWVEGWTAIALSALVVYFDSDFAKHIQAVTLSDQARWKRAAIDLITKR